MRINQESLDEIRRSSSQYADGRYRFSVTTKTWNHFRLCTEPDGMPEDVVFIFGFTGPVPKLDMTYEWRLYQHQCGGHACNQVEFVGAVIQCSVLVHQKFLELSRSYYAVDYAHFYPLELQTDSVWDYAARLKDMGLTCNGSLIHLQEALYPVEGTDHNLQTMTSGRLKMADLVDLDDSEEREFWKENWRGYRPAIFCVTSNSD